jgi:hypothetical protein
MGCSCLRPEPCNRNSKSIMWPAALPIVDVHVCNCIGSGRVAHILCRAGKQLWVASVAQIEGLGQPDVMNGRQCAINQDNCHMAVVLTIRNQS